MAGFEQTIIIGNVGRDPEKRFTSGGAELCSFSVAVTTKWTDRQTQERREKVNWYRVTCWGRSAEIASQYVHKGTQIMVEGTATADAYMGQDGTPRASLNLKANTFQLLGGRGGSGGGSSSSSYNSGGGYDDAPPPPSSVDDIPF